MSKKPSDIDSVRDMYDASADSYAEMMDSEIQLPLYTHLMERLRTRIEDLPGPIIDTSCGPGHMLAMYHELYEHERPLLGVDLSPHMVALAKQRLGESADILVGDMRDLADVESDSAAAIISFFALHHVDIKDVRRSLAEWHRALASGGELLLATWEGTGTVDYGDAAYVVALRHDAAEIDILVHESGFDVVSCIVEPVAEMSMDAIYVEAVKK